jgi:penicillin amidase
MTMRLRTVAHMARLSAWLRFLAPRPPRPGTIDLATRLAALPLHDAPLERPCTIRWNDHAVPFIEAENDHDLAVALGMVHAHLRLGQMEVLRRVAYGRLSEMVGAAAVPIDHTIRIIDLARVVPDIVRGLPEETRAWIDAYASGINHVLHRAPLPHEFALFNLAREPWQADTILTLGRLLSFDNTWLVWRGLLQSYDQPGWQDLWAKLVAHGALQPTGQDDAIATAALAAVNNRSGSNALAISAQRAGRAWLASDPHLGLSLPCLWVMAGYRTPERAAVGFMIPGTPFLGMGRSERIAWGGTSMHAHASELCDVSALDDRQLTTRQETIRVRWGRPRQVTVRSCDAGPVISDSALFKSARRLAMRWMGHRPSDEITAMLRLSTAQTWSGFRSALQSFAVPGLNMLYADAAGHIGHALAAWVPNHPPVDGLVVPSANSWTDILHADRLPGWSDPSTGVLASANDRPPHDSAEFMIGRFFSPPGRADRLSTLAEQAATIDTAMLGRLQQDVKSETSLATAQRLAQAAREDRLVVGRSAELLQLLESWDGYYDEKSRGASLYELLLHDVTDRFYPRGTLAAYRATWAMRDLICADLQAAPSRQIAPLVRAGLKRLARRRAIPAWGELHRLRLEHSLGSLPGGKRYRFFDLPVGGTSDTVMKTSNVLANGRHAVRFGSNARQICDMADPDENHFALLGGQDGWFGSTTFLDQVGLWREGRYILMPLGKQAVRAAFPHAVRVTPPGQESAET